MPHYKKNNQHFERYKLSAFPRKDTMGCLIWPLTFMFTMSCDSPEEVELMLETIINGRNRDPERARKAADIAHIVGNFCRGDTSMKLDPDFYHVSPYNLERHRHPFFKVTVDFWRPGQTSDDDLFL